VQNILSYLPVFSLVAPTIGQLHPFHDLVTSRLAARGLTVGIVQMKPGRNDRENMGGRLDSYHVSNDGRRYYVWQGGEENLGFMLRRMATEVDLVFLERQPDPGLSGIMLVPEGGKKEKSIFLPDIEKKPEGATAAIIAELGDLLIKRPVWACILIGGQSSRMGRPKHLLPDGSGGTWLERTVHVLQPLVAGVALSGGGELPATLATLPRLCDIPGVCGPLTGILSAMRWQPSVSWLLLACDMPGLSGEAVTWLLSQRAVGRWGVVPTLAGNETVEPLFASYEPQCSQFFEMLHDQGVRQIRRIVEYKQVNVVEVPENLQSGWHNINTPEELRRFNGSLPVSS